MRREEELKEAFYKANHLQIEACLTGQLFYPGVEELEYTKQVLGWALGYGAYQLPEAVREVHNGDSRAEH